MKKLSAGILLFRQHADPEVFLVHPGGPFWAKKDAGAWSIPKGEYQEDEEPLAAAQREFQEEVGVAVEGEFIALGEAKQPGGKIVRAWALEGDFDQAQLKSNTFTMEWPPKSNTLREFPEVDAGAWFAVPQAQEKILKGQSVFLARLLDALTVR